MRTLLDEILTMETAPVVHSCGCTSKQTHHPSNCNCPQCRPNTFQGESYLNELLSELSGRALNSAVQYNNGKAAGVGWANYFDGIVAKVFRFNYSPDQQAFAKAVADWQATKGLTPDGKLGKDTWNAMKPLLGLSPAPKNPSGAPSGPQNVMLGETPCPYTSGGKAIDKCLNPGTKPCPPIPNLLCMRSVDGIPFEYVFDPVRKDSQSGLVRVAKSQMNREQKFIPATRDALIEFTRNMTRFGMPIKVILTLGSYYCRCISKSNNLSNHSFGEAIDVAGVRWKSPYSFSRVEDTLVAERNLSDPEQLRLFQRINACLRLSFKEVIDYHRSDHRNHYHCDMNNGRPYNVKSKSTVKFVQEALSLALRMPVPSTGVLDTRTYKALSTFSGLDTSALKDATTLKKVYLKLFEKIAAGNF